MKLLSTLYKNFKTNLPIIISFSIVIFAFLISRFPFYYFYPITYWVLPDTYLYFHPAFDIINGHIPLFIYYNPGYSIFVAIIGFISNKISTILLFQSLITLSSVLYLIYVINKSYKQVIVYIASLLMSVYILSSVALQIETILMSDSLYANFLILFISQIILTLNFPKSRNFIILSIIAGFAIMIRSAGIILLLILFLIFIHLIIKKLPLKYLISLFAPVVTILLLIYFYNFFTIKLFTITPSSVSYLPVSVIHFTEPNKKYDKNINKTLLVIKDSIPKSYLNILKKSKNYDTLWKAYHYHNFILQNLFWKTLLMNSKATTYLDESKIVKKMYYNSIKDHKSDYITFFKVNFFESFKSYTYENELFYFSTVPKRYDDLYKVKHSSWNDTNNIDLIYDNIKIKGLFKKYCFKEFSYDKEEKEKSFELSYHKLKQNIFYKIYDLYYIKIHSKVFKNVIWVFIYFIIGIFSILKLIISKFKNKESIILSIIFLIPFISFLLNSMVEISDSRYSFPCEFCYFISIPLFFIFFKDMKRINQ